MRRVGVVDDGVGVLWSLSVREVVYTRGGRRGVAKERTIKGISCRFALWAWVCHVAARDDVEKVERRHISG